MLQLSRGQLWNAALSRPILALQVTAVKTSREAMQHLLPSHTGEEDERAAGPQQAVPVDLVIKEHEPPSADAGRLLRKMARNELLRRIPVVGEFGTCARAVLRYLRRYLMLGSCAAASRK